MSCEYTISIQAPTHEINEICKFVNSTIQRGSKGELYMSLGQSDAKADSENRQQICLEIASAIGVDDICNFEWLEVARPPKMSEEEFELATQTQSQLDKRFPGEDHNCDTVDPLVTLLKEKQAFEGFVDQNGPGLWLSGFSQEPPIPLINAITKHSPELIVVCQCCDQNEFHEEYHSRDGDTECVEAFEEYKDQRTYFRRNGRPCDPPVVEAWSEDGWVRR